MKNLVLGALLFSGSALAADHAEAPGAAADPAADIADLYAWHTTDGKVVAVLTFAGLTAAGGSATYDEDVLYTLHIDNDADNNPDIDVLVRFGKNGAGDWGVQVENLPGTTAAVSGAVETTLTAEGQSVFAGLRDDPFFFDLTGFEATLATGDLSFDNTRDSLAGTNVTAVVVTMDAALATGADNTLAIWATSARK